MSNKLFTNGFEALAFFFFLVFAAGMICGCFSFDNDQTAPIFIAMICGGQCFGGLFFLLSCAFGAKR